MATTITGYFDRDNKRWCDSAGTALSDDTLKPSVTYRMQRALELRLLTSAAAAYTGWATGGPYTFCFSIKNNWNMYVDGALTAGKTGAIVAITADGFASAPAASGNLLLTNAAGESEVVPYTSWTLAGSVYTFVVSVTLTYTYVNDDVCQYIVPAMVHTVNADIDQTNLATGRLVIDLDSDTLEYLAQIEGYDAAAGARFELKVYDAGGDIVDVVGGDFIAYGTLYDESAVPPPTPATNFYTKTAADARYTLLPSVSAKTDSYQVAVADANTVITVTHANAKIVTIPLNATAAVPVGAVIEVIGLGAGAVSLDAVAGVTLNGIDGGICALSAQYSTGWLRKIGTDAWIVSGGVGAVS